MQAKCRWMAPDSDDIGASSMYSESDSEMDSSWKLAIKCRRRARLPTSTCKVELRVQTERDRRRLHGKLRMHFGGGRLPQLIEGFLNSLPPTTGFGACIM